MAESVFVRCAAYLPPILAQGNHTMQKSIIEQLLAIQRVKLAEGESIAEMRAQGHNYCSIFSPSNDTQGTLGNSR